MTKRSAGTTDEAATATPEVPLTESAQPDEAVPAGRMDTASLNIEALATVILAREVKPRVGDVRRLAEAVLRKKKKKKGKKDRQQTDGTERKLSKIPGRKSKK